MDNISKQRVHFSREERDEVRTVYPNMGIPTKQNLTLGEDINVEKCTECQFSGKEESIRLVTSRRCLLELVLLQCRLLMYLCSLMLIGRLSIRLFCTEHLIPSLVEQIMFH